MRNNLLIILNIISNKNSINNVSLFAHNPLLLEREY